MGIDCPFLHSPPLPSFLHPDLKARLNHHEEPCIVSSLFATFYCSIHPISKFLNKDESWGAQEEKEEKGEMRKEKNKLKGMKTLKIRRNKDYNSKSKRNEDGKSWHSAAPGYPYYKSKARPQWPASLFTAFALYKTVYDLHAA